MEKHSAIGLILRYTGFFVDMLYRYKQHVCKQVSVGLLVRPHTVSKLERLVVIYRHPTTNNNVTLCGEKSEKKCLLLLCGAGLLQTGRHITVDLAMSI